MIDYARKRIEDESETAARQRTVRHVAVDFKLQILRRLGVNDAKSRQYFRKMNENNADFVPFRGDCVRHGIRLALV